MQDITSTTRPTASDSLLLKPREVARLESIDPATLWRWVKSGKHPAPIRIGASPRFVRADIDRHIAALVAERDKTASHPATPQHAEASNG